MTDIAELFGLNMRCRVFLVSVRTRVEMDMNFIVDIGSTDLDREDMKPHSINSFLCRLSCFAEGDSSAAIFIKLTDLGPLIIPDYRCFFAIVGFNEN
jgi:hypothetical protein